MTADVVGLYPSIPHTEGPEGLCKQYDKFLHKKLPTEDIKMAEFVLKTFFLSLIPSFSNKYLELILVQNSPLPLYARIFMDYIETEFLKTQSIKPWVSKRFIDDVFFIWRDSEENLERFLKELNGFHPNIKFTSEKSKIKVFSWM